MSAGAGGGDSGVPTTEEGDLVVVRKRGKTRERPFHPAVVYFVGDDAWVNVAGIRTISSAAELNAEPASVRERLLALTPNAPTATAVTLASSNQRPPIQFTPAHVLGAGCYVSTVHVTHVHVDDIRRSGGRITPVGLATFHSAVAELQHRIGGVKASVASVVAPPLPQSGGDDAKTEDQKEKSTATATALVESAITVQTEAVSAQAGSSSSGGGGDVKPTQLQSVTVDESQGM